MENEIWKAVKGYESLYKVSNLGRVKSLDRLVIDKRSNRLFKGKILKPTKNNKGYEYVSLCKNGMIEKCMVHRLVAEAFIPNDNNKPYIDHINTKPADNRVENLRWVTIKENNNNPISKEKMKLAVRERLNKPIIQYTTYDNQPIAWWNSITECSKFTGILHTTISHNLIGNNKTVCNKEFYFKYE